MRIFKTPRGAGPAACVTLMLGVMMALVGASAASAVVVEETFTSTGAEQTFTVPAGVTSIHVVAIGGAGGAAYSGYGGAPGGRGAVVSGDVSVTPGTLYVEVGGDATSVGCQYSEIPCRGGFNGGGSSVTPTNENGAGGGGASDVRTVSIGSEPSPGAEASRESRLLIAAGGGAGSANDGGYCTGGAGGDAAEDGHSGGSCGSPAGTGGGAGKATEGGVGGKSSYQTSEAGSLGKGGSVVEGGAGGGGGGLYGGGGGSEPFGSVAAHTAGGAGGGGGSNFVPAGGTSAVAASGAQPSVTITYNTSVTAECGAPATECGRQPGCRDDPAADLERRERSYRLT